MVRLGRDPSWFWNLDFYEWSLWLLRIKHEDREKQGERNFWLALERNWLHMYASSVGVKNKKPSDYYTLPGDDGAEEAGGYTEEEFKNKLDVLLKSRGKKKDG